MALNYTLDLAIDDQSLAILRAAQLKITVAKPVNATSPNVTWLVFDPFKGNKIEWTEEFGVYASPNTIIQNGATITRLSDKFPATDAAYYSFDSSATFVGPNTGTGAPGTGQFKVINNMPVSQYPALTFGLEQKAAINGSGINPSPINAALVPAALNATFTPLTTVYVWLQAEFVSGTVITQVNGDAAIVTYGGSIQSAFLTYDASTGRFVAASPSGKLLSAKDAPHVQLLKRGGVY